MTEDTTKDTLATCNTVNPTANERRVIYQARRGLKELDFYIDPYVKQHYLVADENEKAVFERLLAYEDPDLLAFFMAQAIADDPPVMALISKIKQLNQPCN